VTLVGRMVLCTWKRVD